MGHYWITGWKTLHVKRPKSINKTSKPLAYGIAVHFSEYFYRPQRSWGKAIFSQTCVILFTRGVGVCLSACWDTPGTRHTPADQAPPNQVLPRPGTPPDQALTPEHSILGDTVKERKVCILLECNSCLIYIFFHFKDCWHATSVYIERGHPPCIVTNKTLKELV